MDKYIKYKDIRECRFFQDEEGEWILHADILKIPAADVRPVVHGTAILKEDGRAHCSQCDCPVNSHTWNFCPNCGADMREVEHD